MKDLKILFVFALAIFSSCDLDEDPPYLDKAAFNNPQSVLGTLDGIYAGLASYDGQERRLFVLNGFSGFFNTRRQGGNINNPNNTYLFSLKPNENDNDATQLWLGYYRTIARANTLIANVELNSDSDDLDSQLFEDVVGQAHFVRAWCYFSLTRLFGDVPLLLDLPNNENLMNELTPSKIIYASIIQDAEKAINMINGVSGSHYPKKYAANMLLAKVYMTMASVDYSTAYDIIPDTIIGLNFWQMAYDQAIQVYGQNSLVSDYSSLFTMEGENSDESIFELQISQSASNSQMGRNYTPNNYKDGQSFGWLSVNKDVYDDHASAYPNDSRIEGDFLPNQVCGGNAPPREGATYMSYYWNNNTQSNGYLPNGLRPDGSCANWGVRVYPKNQSRNNYRNAHPYFFKYANKDVTSSNQYDDKNIIIYRYADLLLMLAEISNELSNGEQIGYVTEVLNRAGVDSSGYAGIGQTDFRDKIMKEYRYELLGEGEDAHNNRRRGFDYFLNNVIIPHNTNTSLNFNSLDLTLSTDPSQVMFLPIPVREINTNDLID
jgi:hypothetical protein